MQTRRIGRLDASVIGIGCNNFGWRMDAARTDAVVGAALEVGINLFDTADVYGGTQSEELLGKALGARRDDVLIATKFGSALDGTAGEAGGVTGGAAPSYVRRAAEGSLRRLGTDRIDLYQLHRPDEATPIGDTLAALDELVVEGKVREIGCSNFSAGQLDEAAAAVAGGAARFVSVQNNYSILHREPEPEVLEACGRLGMSFLPFFPLASGLLTGKYRAGEPPAAGTRFGSDPRRAERDMTPERMATVSALSELAGEAGATLLELAFAWLLARDAVASVIAGATRPDQVRANAATATFEASPDLLARIDEIAPR
ncbi:MAG TPA: aldo/keto reductase [Acidimicrobiales bacterium]|nr:aldo/keto reductase [Acidimicrobiales bacterium]